mmetsp:Transcript_47189/g.156415  ORF Transcript_47189/g.156415 Transcript_47189/m.156415 type:complete len:272 (-) Transcript_47189:16-831(-)
MRPSGLAGRGARTDPALGRVGHRRVVEIDARLAVGAPLVAEGVLDRGHVAGRGAGEVVRAHRRGRFAVEVDLVVGEDHLAPPLAAVDGEAGVLALELVVLHRLGAHKVRHRLGARRAEGVLGRLGRLEEHVVVAVAVQLARRLARRRDKVALLEVDGRDGRDRVGPLGLALEHLRLGDGRRRSHRRRRELLADRGGNHIADEVGWHLADPKCVAAQPERAANRCVRFPGHHVRRARARRSRSQHGRARIQRGGEQGEGQHCCVEEESLSKC